MVNERTTNAEINRVRSFEVGLLYCKVNSSARANSSGYFLMEIVITKPLVSLKVARLSLEYYAMLICLLTGTLLGNS